MKIKPFGNNITPACEYCAFGRQDGAQLLCAKKKRMHPKKLCRAFDYDPIMRKPRQPLPLPEYSKEQFEL